MLVDHSSDQLSVTEPVTPTDFAPADGS
jgi:hypothetical protein